MSGPALQSVAPLAGLRIIELAGIGPGPFAAMMLADHGAEVIRITAKGRSGGLPPERDILLRGREGIPLDLKDPADLSRLHDLVQTAHGLIEGFRPGVIERLGLGPEALWALNKSLVIGRMTGWGQSGPMAPRAGHDINYIALSGALHAIGVAGEKPVVPLNLVGDFGGGGMLLAFGMVSALLQARSTGRGVVVDAAMTEGTGLLLAMLQSYRQAGRWSEARGTNLLDGGAPFYDTYETADQRFVAIGAIEPQFYAALLQVLGLHEDPRFARQMDEAAWPQMRQGFRAVFASRSRDDWDAAFEGLDACYSPVLSPAEAVSHPHARARGSYVQREELTEPAPAPRFYSAKD